MRKLVLLLMFCGNAWGADIVAYKDEPLTVAINSVLGSLVEFKVPLKLIPTSKFFKIKSVETEFDSKTKMPINITIVNILPLKNGVEIVPIMLANGKTVLLRLISRKKAVRHYRIVFAKNKVLSSGDFLKNETDLMIQMIKDERSNVFNRKILDNDIDVEKLDSVGLRLIRIFKGENLTGYSFSVKNKTDRKIDFKPEQLKFTQAILMHMNDYSLESCKMKDTICKTTLHLVFRENTYSASASRSRFPFVLGGDK